MTDAKHRKIVVCGCRSVGKSAVTVQGCEHRFEASYIPTIEHTYKKVVTLQGVAYEVVVVDTAGLV